MTGDKKDPPGQNQITGGNKMNEPDGQI